MTDWLTRAEAAELVGCQIGTIEWWAGKGRIVSRDVGRGHRTGTLDRASVEEFSIWWHEHRRPGMVSAERTPRTPPDDEQDWINTARASEILGRSPQHVTWLGRRGAFSVTVHNQRVWLLEHQVRAFAEDYLAWVSFADASEIVGCHRQRIERAVAAGQIEQRDVPHNMASLRRTSVEAYAEVYAAEQAETEVRRRREAQEAELRRREPPDTEHVWLDSTTVALMLRCSKSTIANMARADRLPYTTHHGVRWFRRDLIEQVAAARAARPVRC